MASATRSMRRDPGAIPSRSTRLNQSEPVSIAFQAKGFKPQPDPHTKEVRAFRMRAAASTLPKTLLDWMEVNPREQNLRGPLMKAMTTSWDDYPHEFHRLNRGLLIFARELKYDGDRETVTLLFQNKQLDGVGDGGHTVRHVLLNLVPATTTDEPEEDSNDAPLDQDVPEETEPIERYIEVEVMTGLSLPEISRISRARNTSKNVPEYAIKNLQGTFDHLRAAIKKANPEFESRCVAFKPSEHIEGSDEFKPISVLDVLQLLTCMDISNYDDEHHPIEAYKNRGKMDEFFSRREDTYRRMYPIVGDILSLYDRLRQRVPDAYNSRRKKWGTIIKERIGTGLKEELYYLDPSGETVAPKAPSALFYPMLSAFRAALRNGNGEYSWIDESPTLWPEEEFDEVSAKLAGRIASAVKTRKEEFHVVGRDNAVWGNCFDVVKGHLLESGRVQPKARRR